MVAVSVVMPVYNAEKTLGQAIDSVLSQTYPDFELLLIDDCSTDGSPGICVAYAARDARVRFFRNDVNKGVAYTRNRGVREARAQLVAYLDSDDLWQQEKLQRHLRFIQETQAVISYTASGFMDADGQMYTYILGATEVLTYAGLLRRNLMSCSSVIVRRDLMLENPFADGLLHEDYAAWLRIVRAVGAAYGLDEPLLVYRISKDSRSGQRLRSGLMTYRAYRAVDYGPIMATLLTLRYALHSIRKRRQLRL